MEITKLYNKYCNETSDINEHLHTLYKYASFCSHVTEIGVRYGVSSCALFHSNPKKMVSYDIIDVFTIKDILIESSKERNIDFDFIIGDSLKIEIEQTDLLFIDTLHTYNQLIKELHKHSKNVTKYIILHDTTTFGQRDEYIYNHASNILKKEKVNKQGLFNAVNDFLLTEEGLMWSIIEKFDNNNGLTILKRK